MPKLGAYTEDVLLAQWLVDEGQEVEPGGVVFELETDKTNAEVEAETAGWVHRLVPAGQTVPIGTTVALIAETREEYDALAAGGAADSEAEETVGIRSSATSARVAERRSPRPPAPSCRRRRDRRPRRSPRRAAPRSSRRAHGPCSSSSASRSTTRARSPAPGPAAASSTATSPPGLPAATQRRAPAAAGRAHGRADDPAARAARDDRETHGLEPADRRPADVRARARREAARRAAHAPERAGAPHRASASRRSS